MRHLIFLSIFWDLTGSMGLARADERILAEAPLIPIDAPRMMGPMATPRLSYRIRWIEDQSSPPSTFLDLQVTDDPCRGNPQCKAPIQIQLHRYRVVGRLPLRCSAQRLFAVADKPVSPEAFLGFDSPVWTLVLDDRRQSTCSKDPEAGAWMVSASDLRLKRSVFRGKPESPVVTPDCDALFANRACTTEYQPSSCEWTDNTRPKGSSFYATGSNRCAASIDVLHQACRAGFDPAQIEDEVTCQDQCIPPACAAPPPNCRYETPTIDRSGCLVSCGPLSCDNQKGPSL